MKKIICLILVLGVAVMVGCAQEKPEATAKKIFEQQVAGDSSTPLWSRATRVPWWKSPATWR